MKAHSVVGDNPRLYYRKDRDRFRVWRDDWYAGSFEVLTAEQFEALTVALKPFNLEPQEATD